MSDSGSMPTSDQGVLYNQAVSLEESLLACFTGSMDSNWEFDIVMMGSSIFLIMSPWIHKSLYSKVRTELNLNCVWTYKLTGLANNCKATFTDALPLS